MSPQSGLWATKPSSLLSLSEAGKAYQSPDTLSITFVLEPNHRLNIYFSPMGIDFERAAADFEHVPVIHGGKRLGVRWTPWMGDHFNSWSPRNANPNAEGDWHQWAHLAAQILTHPLTKQVCPELYRPDLPTQTGLYYVGEGKRLEGHQIAELIDEHGPIPWNSKSDE